MRKRQAYSIFLLGIILPAFFLSLFHHHPAPQAEDARCVQCTDHVPHGHLSTDQHLSDCLICHFLGLPYLAGKTQVFRTYFRPVGLSVLPGSFDLAGQHGASFLTRGPPFIFCCLGL